MFSCKLTMVKLEGRFLHLQKLWVKIRTWSNDSFAFLISVVHWKRTNKDANGWKEAYNELPMLPLFPLSSKKNTEVQQKFTCLSIHVNKNHFNCQPVCSDVSIGLRAIKSNVQIALYSMSLCNKWILLLTVHHDSPPKCKVVSYINDWVLASL